MRRRVLISILLVVAATALALGVPLGILAWNSVAIRERTVLLARLDSVTGYLQQNAHTAQLDDAQLRLAMIAGSQLTVVRDGFPTVTVGDPVPSAFVETNPLDQGVVVTLAVPLGPVRSQQWASVLLVVAAVALSSVVGAAIALVLARRLSAPLREAADRAARLGVGDFRVVPRRYRITELDRMMDVLDSAAEDISALVGRERDLAEDISHQLRTRLAGLRLSLEEADLSPGESDPLLRDALGRTDELVAVVDEILAAARSRRAAGSLPLDLRTELDALAQRWRPSLAVAGRDVTVDCEAGAVVHATPVRLREALSGLLDNALQHGAGQVSVRVRTDRRMVVIEVSDEGPGIPEALVGHVFDRGVSTASSTGIGLGLARAFIEADGGRLELRQASPPVFGIFLAAALPANG